MQTTRIFLVPRLTRQFSVSSINQKYQAREGRFMAKLLRGSQSKKKWYNTHDYMPSVTAPGLKKQTPSIQASRRVTVLNKVFMRYITDLMSTGEASADLLDRSIEVSHVEVATDFRIINVFWIEHDIDTQQDLIPTEELLFKCAKTLRLELSQLRVIGIVPPIQFVKSKRIAVEKEVERRLKIADYGEDFIPSVYPHSVNQVVTFKESSNNSIIETAAKNKNDNVEDEFQIVLPVMRNDVFNIDHHKIMSRIKATLNKSREGIKKRELSAGSIESIPCKLNTQDIPPFISEKEQKEQFAQFLSYRKREEAYRYKMKYCKKRNVGLNNIQEDEEDNFDNGNIDYDTDDNEDEFDDYDDAKQ